MFVMSDIFFLRNIHTCTCPAVCFHLFFKWVQLCGFFYVEMIFLKSCQGFFKSIRKSPLERFRMYSQCCEERPIFSMFFLNRRCHNDHSFTQFLITNTYILYVYPICLCFRQGVVQKSNNVLKPPTWSRKSKKKHYTYINFARTWKISRLINF